MLCSGWRPWIGLWVVGEAGQGESRSGQGVACRGGWADGSGWMGG